MLRWTTPSSSRRCRHVGVITSLSPRRCRHVGVVTSLSSRRCRHVGVVTSVSSRRCRHVGVVTSVSSRRCRHVGVVTPVLPRRNHVTFLQRPTASIDSNKSTGDNCPSSHAGTVRTSRPPLRLCQEQSTVHKPPLWVTVGIGIVVVSSGGVYIKLDLSCKCRAWT